MSVRNGGAGGAGSAGRRGTGGSERLPGGIASPETPVSQNEQQTARIEQRLRRAAEVILSREVLPGPTPLPDFEGVLRRGAGWERKGRIVLGAGVVAALVLGSAFVLSGRRQVSYIVDGPVAITGTVVEALAANAAEPPARMRFSEGSEIALARGARMRVVNRGALGADLVLERGRAGFSVTHRRGARWSVTSGPFTVEVVGTDFAVDWSPSEERMVLDLTAGRVRVRGASVGGPIEMNAGERLVATVRDHRVTLAPLASPAGLDASPAGLDASPVVAAPSTGSAPPSSGAPVAVSSAVSTDVHSDVSLASTPKSRTVRPGAREAVGSGGVRRAPELAMASPARGADRSEARRTAGSGWSSPSSNPLAPTPPAAATPYPRSPALLPEPPDLRPSTFAAPVIPTLTLGGGGVFCSRETAQYRFEQPEEGISSASMYTLALANPDLDSTHSWCGAGAIRFRASFTDQGRRNYFGRYLRETGQMVIRLDRPTDFTGRTVTMHVFVEGPADARFSAEIFVVHQGHWAGSEPMRELSPGCWWTVKHTFKALNPTGGSDSSNPAPYPGEGLSPVSACNRVSLAIRTTGPRRNWTGAVYVDDVGWR